MSKRKYERGEQIRSITEFDQSKADYFIVCFGVHPEEKPQTKHRSFLISLQYRVLFNFIAEGRIFEAKKMEAEHAEI